jgi:hypothetical protein
VAQRVLSGTRCAATGLDTAECWCCPAEPAVAPEPPAQPRLTLAAQLLAQRRAAQPWDPGEDAWPRQEPPERGAPVKTTRRKPNADRVERMLKGMEGWFLTELADYCSTCGRHFQVGELVRYRWGVTAKDMRLQAWCCEGVEEKAATAERARKTVARGGFFGS